MTSPGSARNSRAWRLLRAGNAPLVLSFLRPGGRAGRDGDRLGSLDLTYWGDLDTHGFAILNRPRSRFPQARSMLMDRETLLAHRSQWVTEAAPTKAVLGLLDVEEQGLYQDLVNGTLGRAVRLEQERVSFGCLERALAGR